MSGIKPRKGTSMPRRLFVFIAAFALALVIAGCSSGGSSTSSSASASSVSPSSSSVTASSSTSSNAAAEPLAIIADDDVCKIVVTGVSVDAKDGPGYNIDFTNKGKKTVDIGAVSGSFTVNGQECHSYMSYPNITAGTTKKVFLHFGKGELDSSVDALTDVHGKLEVIDSNNWETLGEYEFNM